MFSGTRRASDWARRPLHHPQLEVDQVSREHARIIISADAIEIEDLDSTSGTYLDGVIVKGRIPIQPGQKLWISELYIDIERQGFGGLVEGSRLGNGGITLSGQWYYTEDGAQYGPVDEAEIIRLIQDGELPISTPVLQEGHMDWQPARDHACFQVEIYPKKKRPSVQAAASTGSKPASKGTSQPVGQTAAQPAVTPASPAVVTAPVRKKSVLPWALAGVAVMAALIMAVMLFFGDVEETQPNGDTQGPVGTLLWEFETRGNVYVRSSPAIGSDGTVYVGSNDNKLYAINGKSGDKLWEFETGSVVWSSPAIGPDGTVYVGSCDGKLYAIKTASKGPAKSPWPMRGQNALHTGRALKK